MSRTTPSVFEDRELVEMLIGQPELLAIADALVVTHGHEQARRRSARAARLGRVAVLAAAAAFLAGLLVASPWDRGPSLVDRALATVGSGPVLHVVVEDTAAPDESLRDLATGAVIPRRRGTEIWFDAERDLKKTVSTLGGQVLDETLETREGGWSSSGRVYTCAWIAAHPIEATKAGVSCNPSGDNGTTPKQIPETPPTIDLALGGFVDHYRSALASGAATRIGDGTVNGREVVWLRIPAGEVQERVAIDPHTYAPIRVETEDGTIGLDVSLAETVPYDPELFRQPKPWTYLVAGDPSAETAIEPDQAPAVLGPPALWLGRAWKDLRLESVTRQVRPAHRSDGSAAPSIVVVTLSYARVLPDGAVDDHVVELYETTTCLVRVGWSCTAHDPSSPDIVGQPMGEMLLLLRRGGLYVALWGSRAHPRIDLLDVARALGPVGG